MSELTRVYEYRFPPQARAHKARVWRVLCNSFFSRFIRSSDTVLDIGCGLGEFLNNVQCRRRIGVDFSETSRQALDPQIEFHCQDVGDLSFLQDRTIDVGFCSNVLEHLPDKAAVDRLIETIRGKLVPGGRFMIMGPNVRLVPGAYWDFWDHHVAISDRSLSEALYAAGFEMELCLPRFLPYTTRCALPQHPALVRLYLAVPLAWRLLGKQFLIVARRPAD